MNEYHSQAPDTESAAGYQQFNNIDWNVNISGRKLLRNSMRITADIVYHSDGATILEAADDIKINNKVGHHSYFNSFQVGTNKGQIEVLDNYPRYINMVTSATHGANDFFTSLASAEGKSYMENSGKVVIQQTTSANSTAKQNIRSGVSFSIQPQIAFNRMLSGNWSFDRQGFISISCILAKNSHALYGGDMVTGTNYKLSNVRLEYQTIPDDGKLEKILASSYVLVPSVVNSTVHNLSARVAANASSGVAVSYLLQSKDNAMKEDAYHLDVLPLADELQYLFNSSMQKYLTYGITNRNEMVSLGIEALKSGHHNSCKGDNLSSNKGYITGLPFSETIDLSNQRFTIQTTTSNNQINVSPYNQYCYFSTILAL